MLTYSQAYGTMIFNRQLYCRKRSAPAYLQIARASRA